MPHTTTLVRRIRRTAQSAYRFKVAVDEDAYREGKPCFPNALQAEYETACGNMIPGNCKDRDRIRRLAMSTRRDK